MSGYPTPHIDATPADFAPTVLMPGDPLRSRFIAETFLESPRLVNNVRGVQGYTGTYRGTPVSVMASGMGMPSIGIYSYELYTVFGVENIIRVGSAGGMTDRVRLRDVVLAEGACTDSNYAHDYRLPGTFAPVADFDLLRTAADQAEKLGLSYAVGNVVSSDVFYHDGQEVAPGCGAADQWRKMGVLAVEMEAAALYMNAARTGKRALAVLTVSDHLLTGESLPAEARQTSFTDMMKLSLETAVAMAEKGSAQ
ncbi:MAG: purine-nucleoside phosphorylase [Clostridia bacterium]|nr:purine-nucleoside phosphorylase [Clostridia bacterium]